MGDVLSYIEVPANTFSSFTKFVDEKYVLEKGRKTKSYTLNLEKPGTILSNLPLDDLDIIDSLTIVGFLYDTDMKIFAQRLLELRNERHVSQAALAKAIGVSYSIICYWETDRREPTGINLL